MSRYLEHLPALFQEQDFLGELLLAFERILTGLRSDLHTDDEFPPGLEQILSNLDTLFDPLRTIRSEFLPWLATWVATSLREDWDEGTKRAFIANIVPLYAQRGTPAGLQALLQLYLAPGDDLSTNRFGVELIEHEDFKPRYFQVQFTAHSRDPAMLARQAEIATYIIDREKPAHTYYGLRINTPALQIVNMPDSQHPGIFVGTNTTLGTTAATLN